MLYRIRFLLHGEERVEVGSYATIRRLADYLHRKFRIVPTIERVHR